MNADRLLDGLNRLGDEPETVQQFRKLVVGLAMSGKLIAPDEAVMDPASLLKQIEAKKRILVQQGALRKQSPWAALSVEALPKGFHNPSSFVRLGDIARIEKGQTGIMKAEPGDYPLVVTAEERANCVHFDFDGAAAIVPLVSSTGHGKASLHRLHYQEGKFALGSILAAIFPHAPELISARFLFEYLTSFKDELLVSQMIGTANVTLSVGRISDVPVPLVPPSVQRKVDELMGLCDRLETARGGREAARDRLVAATLARLNAPDPKTFQANARFALIALRALTARPDQIKQIRQTIVNLAVCGKLVEQDAKDGTGGELLRKLAKLRDQVRIGGRGRRETGEKLIAKEETYLDTPSSWTWARVHEVGMTQTGTSPSSSNSRLFGNYVPFVKPADLDGSAVNYDGPGLSEEGMSHSRVAQTNTVLMVCIGATLGKVNITDRKICFNQQINSVTPYLDGMHRFVALALKATGFQQLAWSKAGTGTLPIISKGKWEILPFPLPPLAEQHRIVAKVDALMALCDRLEASLTVTAATRRRLLDALLAEALAPVDARELEAAE